MAEKFGCVMWVVVEHMATVSNLNPSYVELLWVELSKVELGLVFDKKWCLRVQQLAWQFMSMTTIAFQAA